MMKPAMALTSFTDVEVLRAEDGLIQISLLLQYAPEKESFWVATLVCGDEAARLLCKRLEAVLEMRSRK